MNNLVFFIYILSFTVLTACSSGGGSGNKNATTSSSAQLEPSITLQLEAVTVTRLENGSEESVEGLPIQGTKIKFE